mmetsp:Transcript_14758/g.26671  ORF Transcript_14758/g.26671 Transcript_14758/m.26671 type:complete len:206 (-) Transcript_14758:597-1214(-)
MRYTWRNDPEEVTMPAFFLWQCFMRGAVGHPHELASSQLRSLSDQVTQMLTSAMTINDARHSIIDKRIPHLTCVCNARRHEDTSIVLVGPIEAATSPVMLNARSERRRIFTIGKCSWGFNVQSFSSLCLSNINIAFMNGEVSNFSNIILHVWAPLNQWEIILQVSRKGVLVTKYEWHHVYILTSRLWKFHTTAPGKSDKSTIKPT